VGWRVISAGERVERAGGMEGVCGVEDGSGDGNGEGGGEYGALKVGEKGLRDGWTGEQVKCVGSRVVRFW
jgi:hypothetical protein